MNRIGLVLKHAAAMDLPVDLQATAKAKELLGKSRHVVKNVPAMRGKTCLHSTVTCWTTLALVRSRCA